jgi:hypothetical protein
MLSALPLTGAAGQALRGVVHDAATGRPISETTILVQQERGSLSRRITTDSAGTFTLTLPTAGLFRVNATKLGYIQHRGDTVRIGDGETVVVRIELDRTATPLRPVVVTERFSGLPDGFESRRASGFGRFLTRTDIEARRGTKTTDLLRGMPGIVLTQMRRGRGGASLGAGQVLLMRSPVGLCQPAIWIDGLLINDFPGMSTTDDLLSPGVLEAVEVYNSTSNAPAQYRTGNCGVVLFWTRRGSTEERARIKWWKLALGATAGIGLVLLVR